MRASAHAGGAALRLAPNEEKAGAVISVEDQVAESVDGKKSEETRRAPRVRTFLQARVSYGDGALSIECTVNQLSDVGARVNLASTFALPDTFDIAIPQRDIARRAKLVWRKDDQVGIEFVDGEESHPAHPPNDSSARVKALEAENAKLKAQIGVLTAQIRRLTDD